MSLLNLVLERDRAVVAVDTLCRVGTPDGSALANKGKLFLLPHARMALAGRGDIRVLASLHLASLCSPGELDIDSIGPSLGQAAQHVVIELQRADPLWRFVEAELVAVGWSASREAMVAFAAVRNAGDADFRTVEITSTMLGPDPSCPTPANLATPEAMEWLSRQQVKRFRSLVGDDAGVIGGRLLFAEIRRDSQRVRELGDLP